MFLKDDVMSALFNFFSQYAQNMSLEIKNKTCFNKKNSSQHFPIFPFIKKYQ